MDCVVGYEARYTINKQGELWSVCQQKMLKLQTKYDGYLCINLTKNTKEKHKCYLHRLLAIQYIPNPENKPEIDHIDRNRTNNDLANLRWVTKLEQNNNKSTNLSAEEKVISKAKYVAWQAQWARDKKANMTEEDKETKREYHNEWNRKKSAEMTEENRAEMNRKRREYKASKKMP